MRPHPAGSPIQSGVGVRSGGPGGHGGSVMGVRARLHPRGNGAGVWPDARLSSTVEELGKAAAQLELSLRRHSAPLVAVDHPLIFGEAVLLLQLLHAPRERFRVFAR